MLTVVAKTLFLHKMQINREFNTYYGVHNTPTNNAVIMEKFGSRVYKNDFPSVGVRGGVVMAPEQFLKWYIHSQEFF